MQCLLGFAFDNDLLLYKKVGPKPAVELHVFLNHRHGLLSLDEHPLFLQFVSDTRFIGRFEQAGAVLGEKRRLRRLAQNGSIAV